MLINWLTIRPDLVLSTAGAGAASTLPYRFPGLLPWRAVTLLLLAHTGRGRLQRLCVDSCVGRLPRHRRLFTCLLQRELLHLVGTLAAPRAVRDVVGARPPVSLVLRTLPVVPVEEVARRLLVGFQAHGARLC